MPFPWEQKDATLDGIEARRKEIHEQTAFDPCMYVRLRISHGDVVKYVGIRADDNDITGELKFTNGSKLVAKAWGVPTKNEPLMTSLNVMKLIEQYVKNNGLEVV